MSKYHGFLLILMLVMASLVQVQAQSPRQLTAQEIAKLKERLASGKSEQREREKNARAAQMAEQHEQQQEADRLRQEGESRRAEEEAIAQAEWEAERQQQSSQPSFADMLAHGMGVFQGEMAKKDAEQAEADTRIARMRRQAEAAERERERQRVRREREAQQLQRQVAQQKTVQAQSVSGAETARERQLRESVAVERERMQRRRQDEQQAEQQRIAAEKVEADRQNQAEVQRQLETEQHRLAAEQEKQRRQQALRQAEQNLRNSFYGSAITCVGGGKDVLYLKSSQPPKIGCNVSFEARCPGTPFGAGVRFSQGNYIGASCGFGDSIRIGTMSCPAEQVQITMTSADCGS